MNYIGTNDISKMWNISPRSVVRLASAGKIPGAKYIGKTWLIPENAVKPVDGRTRESKNQIEADNFIFPLFHFCEYYKKREALSDEAKLLYDAEDSFYKCDYEKAYDMLISLSETCRSIYIKVGCVYYLIHLSMLKGNSNDYSKYLKELNEILNTDSNHPKEFDLIMYDIKKLYIGTTDSDNIPFDINYKYDTNVYSYMYLIYSYDVLLSALTNKGARDTYLLELLCKQYYDEELYPVSQLLHLRLAFIYNVLGQTQKKQQHLKKALDIAVKTEHYYFIAHFLGYIENDFDIIINNYYPELRNKFRSLAKKIDQNSKSIFSGQSNQSISFILSKSELMLAFHINCGLSNKAISELLSISESAVSKRISILYEKLGVTSRNQLKSYLSNIIKNYTYTE